MNALVEDCGGSLNGVTTQQPLRATLGAARTAPFGPFDVSGTGAVTVLRERRVLPAGGAELGYSWLDGYNVLLRAGLRRPERGEQSS